LPVRLPPGQRIRKNGKLMSDTPPFYCSSMASRSLTPNTKYDYRWGLESDDDCTTAEGCVVRMHDWFYQDTNRPAGTGLIDLVGFVTVANTSNVNPFADTFTGLTAMQIERLIIAFKGDGTNTTVAVCRWSAADGNLVPGDVEFHSVPVP
jgi:hypothetical protein